jgi:hypothetical protein
MPTPSEMFERNLSSPSQPHSQITRQRRDESTYLTAWHGECWKFAVAFIVAEMVTDLKVRDEVADETRLAGSFFFSRRHTSCCTTEYSIIALAYQLSVQEDVNRAVSKILPF